MDAQALRNRIITGIAWLAATKALGQAITWIITIVVLRMLSPQDYGLMGMAVLVTGFLLLFNEFGLGAAIVQNPALKADLISDLKSAIVLINVGLFLLMALAAPLVAAYFGEPALSAIVQVLSVTFVINGLGAPSMYMLQRELAFKKKSKAELIGNIAGGISTLACAAAGSGVWSLVIGYLSLQVVMNALYCWYRPVKQRWRFSFANIRRLVAFGFQVAGAKVLWYTSSNADFIVVGRMLGTVQLGYYSLAFQFSSLPIEKVVSIITQVAFPSFAALQNDAETLKRYYLRLLGTVALITFPMFVGLFLIADSAVRLFLTDKWLPVVLPLKLLCIVSCVRAIEAMNSPLILAKGRPRIALLNNLLQAIVLPIAFYVGARSGLQGVAIAWLIAWPILFAIVTSQTLQLIGATFGAYARALGHATAASLATVAITTAVQRSLLAEAQPAITFTATVVLSGLVYLGYHALFNTAAIREALATISPRAANTVRSSRPERDLPGSRPVMADDVALKLEPVTAKASLVKAE